MSRSSSIVSELDGSRIGDDDVPIISVRSRRPKSLPIPYKAIFTSVPFYAILIAHCCQNWGFYTLLTELPTYMSKILHFDIKEVIFIKSQKGPNYLNYCHFSERFIVSFTVLYHVDSRDHG